MRDKSGTGPAKSGGNEGHSAAERPTAPIWSLRDDIDVRVTNSTLVLGGEKKDEHEEGGEAKQVNANAGARQI